MSDGSCERSHLPVTSTDLIVNQDRPALRKLIAGSLAAISLWAPISEAQATDPYLSTVEITPSYAYDFSHAPDRYLPNMDKLPHLHTDTTYFNQTWQETSADCDTPQVEISVGFTAEHDQAITAMRDHFLSQESSAFPSLLTELTAYYQGQINFVLGTADNKPAGVVYPEEYLQATDFDDHPYAYQRAVNSLLSSLQLIPYDVAPHIMNEVRIIRDVRANQEQDFVGAYVKGPTITAEYSSLNQQLMMHEFAHSLDIYVCRSLEDEGTDYHLDETIRELTPIEYVGHYDYRSGAYQRYSPEVYMPGPNQVYPSPYGMTGIEEHRATTLEYIMQYGLPQEGDANYGSPLHRIINILIHRYDRAMPGFASWAEEHTRVLRRQAGAYISRPESFASYVQRANASILPASEMDIQDELPDLTQQVVTDIQNGQPLQIMQGWLICRPDYSPADNNGLTRPPSSFNNEEEVITAIDPIVHYYSDTDTTLEPNQPPQFHELIRAITIGVRDPNGQIIYRTVPVTAGDMNFIPRPQTHTGNMTFYYSATEFSETIQSPHDSLLNSRGVSHYSTELQTTRNHPFIGVDAAHTDYRGLAGALGVTTTMNQLETARLAIWQETISPSQTAQHYTRPEIDAAPTSAVPVSSSQTSEDS